MKREGKYGWIGISTVTKSDGSPHDLTTSEDIFLSSMNCTVPLRVGLEVEFAVRSDERRGGDTFLALGASERADVRLKRLAEGGIELHIEGQDGGTSLAYSSALVSWCFPSDTIEKIRGHRLQGRETMLLITHWSLDHRRPVEYKEKRQLVKITDPFCAISFNRPVTHRIIALVVTGNENNLRDHYLKRSYGTYDTSVITNDGCGILLDSKSQYLASGVIDIEVPKEVFVKKPRDWEWVNRYFGDLPHDHNDQCTFGKRRLFAYSFQPIWELIKGVVHGTVLLANITFFLVLTLILLSVGMRNINFAPLCHPTKYDVNTIGNGLRRSIFIPIIRGYYVVLPLIISPLILLMCGYSAWFFSDGGFGSLNWWKYFGLILLLPFIVLSVLNLLIIAGKRGQKRIREEEGADKVKETKQGVSLSPAQQERIRSEMDALLCSGENSHQPDIRRLPFRPRTIRFHVLALKQRVCRTFSE